MSGAVRWLVELTIKDGQFENFKALMKDMVEAVQTEAGATHYEWFISEDNKTFHVYERYVDSAAVLTHAETFAAFSERFLSIVEPTRLVVYGEPSAEVRAGLKAFDPVYMAQTGGFAR